MTDLSQLSCLVSHSRYPNSMTSLDNFTFFSAFIPQVGKTYGLWRCVDSVAASDTVSSSATKAEAVAS